MCELISEVAEISHSIHSQTFHPLLIRRQLAEIKDLMSGHAILKQGKILAMQRTPRAIGISSQSRHLIFVDRTHGV